jgi:hypothetical protein
VYSVKHNRLADATLCNGGGADGHNAPVVQVLQDRPHVHGAAKEVLRKHW